MSCQERPGAAPGAARSVEELTRSCQERPRRPWSRQEHVGGPRSCQDSQDAPGAAGSGQDAPGAARSDQEVSKRTASQGGNLGASAALNPNRH